MSNEPLENQQKSSESSDAPPRPAPSLSSQSPGNNSANAEKVRHPAVRGSQKKGKKDVFANFRRPSAGAKRKEPPASANAPRNIPSKSRKRLSSHWKETKFGLNKVLSLVAQHSLSKEKRTVMLAYSKHTKKYTPEDELSLQEAIVRTQSENKRRAAERSKVEGSANKKRPLDEDDEDEDADSDIGGNSESEAQMVDDDSEKLPREEERDFIFCKPCRKKLCKDFKHFLQPDKRSAANIDDFRKVRAEKFQLRYSFAFGYMVPRESDPIPKALMKIANHCSTAFHTDAKKEFVNSTPIQQGLQRLRKLEKFQSVMRGHGDCVGILHLLNLIKHRRPISAMREVMAAFRAQDTLIFQRVAGLDFPSNLLTPQGWDGDTNRKLTKCMEATRNILIRDPTSPWHLALQPGLRSLLHDASSHRKQEYLMLGIRHLDETQTLPVNTLVSLKHLSRKDAEGHIACMSQFLTEDILGGTFSFQVRR